MDIRRNKLKRLFKKEDKEDDYSLAQLLGLDYEEPKIVEKIKTMDRETIEKTIEKEEKKIQILKKMDDVTYSLEHKTDDLEYDELLQILLGEMGVVIGGFCSYLSYLKMSEKYDTQDKILENDYLNKQSLLIQEKLSDESVLDSVKENLHAAYPQLDTSNITAENISNVLTQFYNNCHVTENGTTIVKEGWNDYFVDYTNGLLNDYIPSLDGFIAPDHFAGLALGTGAVFTACFLTVISPIILNKLMF